MPVLLRLGGGETLLEGLFPAYGAQVLAGIGVISAFLVTIIFLKLAFSQLPRDAGREFAHDGEKSIGKPRGAGFVFVMVFIVTSIFFLKISPELTLYYALLWAAMMTGFLDDCAKMPWSELKKGLLDLAISLAVAVVYVKYNGPVVHLAWFNASFVLNPVIYVALATLLVWMSINVTNCTDGVDGLSATLSLATLASMYALMMVLNVDENLRNMILVFIACLLGYLWYNATPSVLMMGDAGSRAMGVFIAIVALKTGCPFMYIPLALVLLCDGGASLLKLSVMRLFKVKFMTNIRTPLHDHARKIWNWSNTQTVFRFAIIQIVISVVAIYLSR